MSDHDNFEDRLRAMADQLSRSVQRFSELDLDELAERYGIDADQARTFADTAGQWLSGRLSGAEPFFSQTPAPHPDSRGRGMAADLDDPLAPGAPKPGPRRSSPQPGPHPLDLPTERQGLALAALDSGRWTVRPGSNRMAGAGDGPAPAADDDSVGDLRARDWITADGTLTLVGRHALGRWCRSAEAAQTAPADTGAAPPFPPPAV